MPNVVSSSAPSHLWDIPCCKYNKMSGRPAFVTCLPVQYLSSALHIIRCVFCQHFYSLIPAEEKMKMNHFQVLSNSQTNYTQDICLLLIYVFFWLHHYLTHPISNLIYSSNPLATNRMQCKFNFKVEFNRFEFRIILLLDWLLYQGWGAQSA